MSATRASRRPTWKLPIPWTILVILCARAVGCQSVDPIIGLELLGQLFSGIGLAASFFEEDYSDINVDALFGIRFCQGSLLQTLKDCSQEDFNCPPDLVDKIKAVNDPLDDLGVKALPYIKESNELYFSRFSGLVRAPYKVRYTPERLGAYIHRPGTDSRYNFTVSDECFSGLLGTFVESGRSVPPCTVNDVCWRLMTKPDAAGYFATHQLLYFIVAEQTGCLDVLGGSRDKSVRDVQRQLCGRIFSEAVAEDRGGKVDVLSQDLFIEQILLCGVLGFEDFLRENWIRMILSWQNRQGCFMIDYPPSNLVVAGVPIARLLGSYVMPMKKEDTDDARTGRKLLTEQFMHGDCLAHKTGLGFGTLALYLRYLVRQIYAA